jgi:hypothetical protein
MSPAGLVSAGIAMVRITGSCVGGVGGGAGFGVWELMRGTRWAAGRAGEGTRTRRQAAAALWPLRRVVFAAFAVRRRLRQRLVVLVEPQVQPQRRAHHGTRRVVVAVLDLRVDRLGQRERHVRRDRRAALRACRSPWAGHHSGSPRRWARSADNRTPASARVSAANRAASRCCSTTGRARFDRTGTSAVGHCAWLSRSRRAW